MKNEGLRAQITDAWTGIRGRVQESSPEQTQTAQRLHKELAKLFKSYTGEGGEKVRPSEGEENKLLFLRNGKRLGRIVNHAQDSYEYCFDEIRTLTTIQRVGVWVTANKAIVYHAGVDAKDLSHDYVRDLRSEEVDLVIQDLPKKPDFVGLVLGKSA